MRIRTEAERRKYYDECLALGENPEEAQADTDAWAKPRHPLKELSFAEMCAEPDAGWLVGDAQRPVLIADGLWMDFGPEKTGKTYRALEVAFCIAFGLTYYGLPVRQGNTAYIIAEGGLARTVKRIRALVRKYAVQLRAMGYKNTQEVLDAGRFNLISSAIDLTASAADSQVSIKALVETLAHKPYVAVWMDTWARMLAASGGHSSDMDTVPLALRGCDIIREQLGCTVVLVAHTPLSDKERPKGLNEQTGNVDGATQSEKLGTRDKERFKFTSLFQRHGENDFQMTFRQIALEPDRVFAADDTGFDDNRLSDFPAALGALNILRAMGAMTTVIEWRDKVAAAQPPILDSKNPRSQWKYVMQRLNAVDAIETDGAGDAQVATARPPK